MDKQIDQTRKVKQTEQERQFNKQQPNWLFIQKSYFSELMALYKTNYRLMKALDIFNLGDEVEIQLQCKDDNATYPLPSYRLYIKRLETQPYTETLQLTYNLQKHEPQKPVPLMQANVGVYHDTCQAGATVLSSYNSKYTPFALRIPQAAYLQSLSQKKYYTNALLCAMLERLVRHNQNNNILELSQLH